MERSKYLQTMTQSSSSLPPNELVVVGLTVISIMYPKTLIVTYQADIRRYLKWKKKSELMALLISWVVYAWCGICILGFLN